MGHVSFGSEAFADMDECDIYEYFVTNDLWLGEKQGLILMLVVHRSTVT